MKLSGLSIKLHWRKTCLKLLKKYDSQGCEIKHTCTFCLLERCRLIKRIFLLCKHTYWQQNMTWCFFSYVSNLQLFQSVTLRVCTGHVQTEVSETVWFVVQSIGFGNQFLDTLFFVVPLSRMVGPDAEVIQSISLLIPSTYIFQKNYKLSIDKLALCISKYQECILWGMLDSIQIIFFFL